MEDYHQRMLRSEGRAEAFRWVQFAIRRLLQYGGVDSSNARSARDIAWMRMRSSS